MDPHSKKRTRGHSRTECLTFLIAGTVRRRSSDVPILLPPCGFTIFAAMNTSTFESGSGVESYVRALRNYRSFVRSLVGDAHARSERVAALKTAVANMPQPVRATVMTEDWCGDSACNVPILASLFGGADVELRIIRGSEQQELHDFYENSGADQIPVLSIWDGEFNEIARWVEAPAAVSVRKDAWKAERPEFMELYSKKRDDKDAAKKFAVLYRQFLDEMITWYKAGMWDETTREVVEAIRR